MSVVKHSVTGAYVISDIVSGYLVTRTYYFMTKREAIAAFKAETKA